MESGERSEWNGLRAVHRGLRGKTAYLGPVLLSRFGRGSSPCKVATTSQTTRTFVDAYEPKVGEKQWRMVGKEDVDELGDRVDSNIVSQCTLANCNVYGLEEY
jgi:hypothetical protein